MEMKYTHLSVHIKRWCCFLCNPGMARCCLANHNMATFLKQADKDKIKEVLGVTTDGREREGKKALENVGMKPAHITMLGD